MRHILLLLLLLVTSIQTAHALSDELWICHEDTILKNGDRVIINEYTVKIHGFTPPNGTSASIIPESVSLVLYRNNEFVQMFNIPEGGEYTYFGKVKLKILDIDSGNDKENETENEKDNTSISTVHLQIFIFGNEPLWNRVYGPTTQSENESIVIDEYMFKIGTILDNSANISIIKDSNEVINNSFFNGDKKTYFDNILVQTSNIRNNSTTIEIYRKGSADINIGVYTKNIIYSPAQIIFYDILVNGTNTLPLRDIDVNITVTHDGEIIKTDSEHLHIVSSSNNYILRKTVIPPTTPQGTYLTILANASGFDYMGIKHFTNTSKELTITPYLNIEKSISATDAILNKRKLGQPESIHLTITITNHANSTSPLITLFDEIPQEFDIDTEGNTPKWTLSVEPLETKEITYSIIPKKQGEYNLPSARIEWTDNDENYVIRSNNVKLSVHAPVIIITKSTLYSENDVNVSISIENKGDLAADVEVNDTIPDGVEQTKGTLSWKRMLRPGESGEYSYTIRLGWNGEYTLPPAIASYIDVEGVSDTAYSNTIILGRRGVLEEIEDKETPINPSMLAVFLIKAFFTILAIATIPTLAAYAIAKKQLK